MDGRRIARRLGGPSTRRRRHRRVGALLAGVAAVGGVLVLVGSGSDDDEQEPPSTTAPTTVAAVCRVSNAEIATAQSALLTGNTADNAVEGFLADAFVDLARDRSAAIRDLEPGAEVLALVDDHDAIVDTIDADPAAAAELEESPFTDLNERWRAIELPDCAMDSSTVVSG